MLISAQISGMKDHLISLESIATTFLTPMRALLSPPQITTIFANFEKLLDLNRKLVAALSRHPQQSEYAHISELRPTPLHSDPNCSPPLPKYPPLIHTSLELLQP